MNRTEISRREGFININKPAGITSFHAVRKLKRLEKGWKIGHLGTLDPMAEGVLPVAVGGATRLIPWIPDHSKRYRVEAVLGAVSDTQDIWGEVSWRPAPIVEWDLLQSIIGQFRGAITQVPPMFSAVHHQGRRLYQLARQGLEVERTARPALIHELRLLSSNVREPGGHPVIELEVHCSGGTYIRTLCHDIGQRLGCGAVMSKLVRTAWGVFTLETAVDLEKLTGPAIDWDEIILPADMPLEKLPLLCIEDPGMLSRLYNGNALAFGDRPAEGCLRVWDGRRQRLAALAKVKKLPGGDIIQPVVVLKP